MTDYKQSNNQETMGTSDITQDDEVFSYQDYRIEDWLTFILFWLLAFTVFSQFISRYVFSSPLGWTEELARYQLVCLGFMGGTMGVRKNSHIFVSIFHRWMPKILSEFIYNVIALCNVLFLLTLAYFAWQIIPLIHIHKMASLPVSIGVLYGIA